MINEVYIFTISLIWSAAVGSAIAEILWVVLLCLREKQKKYFSESVRLTEACEIELKVVEKRVSNWKKTMKEYEEENDGICKN